MIDHAAVASSRLLDAVDAALPQTQCRRCGYADCRDYAGAVADGRAEINRCPPGGAEGIVRLAAITGRPPIALDASCGAESVLQLAVIDEAVCIGCTLCLPACPVDAIIGGPKSSHTVLDAACTGCALCLPVCPVDCIRLVAIPGTATGWAAWSSDHAASSLQRYRGHDRRRQIATHVG